ncbi:MAG TPA: stage V sporulation protein B, partial [Bacillales bacterium]|nr:stage V sporulation protein B [Bacillales bacterium]
TLIIRDYTKGLMCIAATAWIASLLQKYALHSAGIFPRTLTLIFLVIMIYIVLIAASGILKKEEVKQLPLIGKWAAKWFK